MIARLRISIFLTFVIFLVEFFGGYFTHSLALMSDSFHVFMDAFALILTFTALKVCELPSTNRMTYGWHRVEIFASLINSLALLVIAVVILWQAMNRIMNPVAEILANEMLIIALVGLAVNVAVALILRDKREHEHDINIKSAYLHILGDAMSSVGVVVAAVVIKISGFYMIDSILSIIIGAVIFINAFRILRESVNIFLEGVPKGIDVNEVVESIKSAGGATGVHNIHIWEICSHIYALSCHVEVDDESKDNRVVLSKINEVLKTRYNITHTTIQMNCAECSGENVLKKLSHS